MSDSHILYEVNDGIGRVTFNRPEARNAFTLGMYERLAEICLEAKDNPALRVLVLTGAGEKAFAAGTDISEFKAFSSPQHALDYEERIASVLEAVETCAVPTLAAIAGACTGGGASIAACCDMRIAAENMRFGVPIARTLGNCLSIPNYARMVALIGEARVKDLIFTARLVTANEAREIGLVSELLPDPSALQTRADEVARTIASHAPLTLRVTKQALRRIRERLLPEDDREMILTCYMSSDFREGMDAFLNKRPPKWTGT